MNSPEFQLNNENSPGDPEYLTREGFEQLQKKLDDLKTRKRQEIAKLLEDAKGDGDLSENSGYQDAQERWKNNEDQIIEIEDILSRAVLFSKEKSPYIQLGSTATIKKEGDSASEAYFLVGPEEVDPLKGKISNESPLGSSLMGKKKGEKAEVITPRGKITYTIIDVG